MLVVVLGMGGMTRTQAELHHGGLAREACRVVPPSINILKRNLNIIPTVATRLDIKVSFSWFSSYDKVGTYCNRHEQDKYKYLLF